MLSFLQERKPSEPIDMVPINLQEDKENSSSEFVNMMRDLSKSPNSSAIRNSSTDLPTFCQTLRRMTITSQRVAKVTKDRIFSVAVHPSKRKILACAGDKWGKIGLWDVVSEID